jgi:hypothetical protein
MRGSSALIAAFIAALICGAAITPAVSAASVVIIRPGDLIAALSDTRSAGHVTFLADGLHVETDDATANAKAAEYFPLTGGIPATASLEWFGTQPQPGQQLVFDADGVDGNGNDFNILVGEPVYGANWWLTNGSSADAKAADPSGANNGGSGSDWFGTLEEWAAALPDARVYAGGFSLGSGVKGDGVIDSVTYDATTFRFTNQPAEPETTVANPHGTATIVEKRHRVVVHLRTQPKPPNTVLGRKLTWKVKVDGHVVAVVRQGFGDNDKVRIGLPTGSGRHVVKVFADGTRVLREVVHY